MQVFDLTKRFRDALRFGSRPTATNVPDPTPRSPEEMQLATMRGVERMLGGILVDRAKERRSAIVRRLLMVFLALLPIIYLVASGYNQYADKRDGKKVPVVTIDGVIGEDQASAKALLPTLSNAFNMAGNHVVLVIHSPGGHPGEAERIRAAIIDLKARKHKTLDVIIDGLGASAAYMIALAGDRIYAGEYSSVGSIGVILQTWDVSELAKKNGVRMHTWKSGSAKALGSPLHAPTPDESNAADALVATLATLFKNDVTHYRNEKLKQPIDQLATGQVWVGKDALALGLIDEIATPEQYFTSKEMAPAYVRVGTDSLRDMMRSSVSSIVESLTLDVHGLFSPHWR